MCGPVCVCGKIYADARALRCKPVIRPERLDRTTKESIDRVYSHPSALPGGTADCALCYTSSECPCSWLSACLRLARIFSLRRASARATRSPKDAERSGRISWIFVVSPAISDPISHPISLDRFAVSPGGSGVSIGPGRPPPPGVATERGVATVSATGGMSPLGLLRVSFFFLAASSSTDSGRWTRSAHSCCRKSAISFTRSVTRASMNRRRRGSQPCATARFGVRRPPEQ